ncbi:M protein repeat protein [Seminavis robusta]|uniref:M protein repeat protein n=1 Tax=Seminavis robusta TaxID=568900 RepID=A0A9N8E5X2_9STRA|nr:M protein repeat protein [Seminavis robusta]|eukprot:Sro705_g190310.1 M protein repeat protein (465) ;mRNA; r:17919-19313
MMMSRICPSSSVLILLLAVCTSCSAFQVSLRPLTVRTSRSGFLQSTSLSSTVDVSTNAARQYNGFVEWASYYGVLQENFQISEAVNPHNGGTEWNVVAGLPAGAGSRALFVPAMLRITSMRARQEEFAALEGAISQYIDATNSNGDINLACHFYLFLKVLQEYDLKDQSPYVAWLDALPRKFSTALEFDPLEMDCLPPFVKYLANQDRQNYDLFLETAQQLDTPTITDATKYNTEITKWAFNVVFSRARAAFGEAEIIPMSDMLNHAAQPNVDVQYDNEGNVHVTFLRDVQQGEELFKCYGQPTNPSRFLATYGFFDTSPPATYCKLMSGKKLTPELKDLGFVYERMVFYPENGGIAEEVWDVMLYTILANIDPAVQQQFYNAHMQGDFQTKQQLQDFYRPQTGQALLNHVDEMLNELAMCAQKIDQAGPGHENLVMIRQHNDFVRETFLKVRSNLEQIGAQYQ